MKPLSIVLSINIAFFAIWGLFFGLMINRPELIPLFTSIHLIGLEEGFTVQIEQPAAPENLG